MINTKLVTKGVAVLCHTKEQAIELFEAMGWNPNFYKTLPKYDWEGSPKYYWPSEEDEGEWDGNESARRVTDKFTIVDFEDLKQPPLAIALGVKVNQRFIWNNEGPFFVGADGQTYYSTGAITRAEGLLIDMINNPEKIIILSEPVKYRKQTINDSKAALRFGFVTVMRYDSDVVKLWNSYGDFWAVPSNCFDEVPKNEIVKLRDIAGDENE